MISQIENDISRIEKQIDTQKQCARYWKSLLRWDYVKDCETNIEELEIELMKIRKQKIQRQIENEWDGVFTFMQVSNDEEMNKCINRIDELEKDLAVCIKKQGV
jgi:hypothetical protein